MEQEGRLVIVESPTGRTLQPTLKDGDIYLEFTKRELDCFRCICMALEQGYTPSLTELAGQMGFKSASTPAYLVGRLRVNLLIETTANQHRSIRLTDFGAKVWEAIKEAQKEEPK